MKLVKIRILTAAFGVLVAALPVFAHHAFEAEFDQDKHITVTGVLTKVDWVNPHAYVYLDAKDEKGQIVHWQFNSVPPLMLKKGGLERSMLVIGQTFTIEGYGAKDGSRNLGWLKTLHFPDGRKIDILRPEEEASKK